MYEVMHSDSAHNGEALFHADKYIYQNYPYIHERERIHVIGDYVEKQLLDVCIIPYLIYHVLNFL